MFFHVRDLEVRKAHFEVALEPGAIEFLEDRLEQDGPLKARGDVELVGSFFGEIRVTGHLNVRIVAACDRCLEPAAFPIESAFELFYRPMPSEFKAGEVEIDPGESEVGFYRGDGLELGDVLREYVLLALPMQRVCNAGCKGICPECGENRNRVACGCRAKAVDDRWAALRHLNH